MDLNLGTILGETNKMVNSLADTSSQILGINDDLSEITKQRVAIDSKAAEAQATKTQIDMQTAADQEARRKAIAARFGTDPTAAGYVIGQSVDTMRAAKAEADKANEKIRMKESVNFLDNPIGWALGKATVNADYADYNYWATQYNNAEKLGKDVEQMTQQAFITSNALTSTVSQSYIDAAKIIDGHKYLDAGYAAAAQGLRWNQEGILAAANISKERLNLFYQGNSAIMQQKQFQVSMEHLQLSKEQFNLQKAAFNEKTTEDALVMKYMQRGFFNLTGQQMDIGRAKEALILFKSKQPDVMMYFQNGMESTSLGGKAIISLSPYDATTLYATSKVQNTSPDQKIILDQLVTWRREFESPAVQTPLNLDKKDKTSMERGFNSFVQEKMKLATANTLEGSPFAPATLKQVGALNKSVQAMPVWKNVLEPAMKSGVNVDDPNVVFGLVTSALEQNKLSYVDAVDLATIYQAGLELNNQTKNFLSVGLPPVRTFYTQVAMPDQIGRTTLNLADSRSIATALNQVSARAMSKLINQRSGNPFGVN